MNWQLKHNKCILPQPLRGLDSFSARAWLQNCHKCKRYKQKDFYNHMNNAEIAFLYAKAALDNEFKTFDSLNTKANNFLSLVTFGIGIVISLSGWGISTLFPIDGFIKALLMFFVFLVLFFLSNAWFAIFRSIKVSSTPTINLSKQAIDTLLDPSVDVSREVLNTFKKLIEVHRNVMSEKVTQLERGYRYISRTAVCILLIVFVAIIAKSEGII